MTADNFGLWHAVKNGFPAWPTDVALIQEAYEDRSFQEVGELITMLTSVAEIILRNLMGLMRYLMGAPLYHDTETLVGSEPYCPCVAKYDFFPSMLLPYLPRILHLSDIDLRGPEARSLIAQAASRIRQLAIRIEQISDTEHHFVECSLRNLRTRTMLQPPRLTRQGEPEETTSIIRTRSRSVDRPARHPRVSDDRVASPTVLGPSSSRPSVPTVMGSIRTSFQIHAPPDSLPHETGAERNAWRNRTMRPDAILDANTHSSTYARRSTTTTYDDNYKIRQILHSTTIATTDATNSHRTSCTSATYTATNSSGRHR
jgi:hypothetical protein